MSQLNERDLEIALTGLRALQQVGWDERKRMIEKFEITMPFISDIEAVIEKLQSISEPRKIISDLVDVQNGDSDSSIKASIEVGDIDGMLELKAAGYSDHSSEDGKGVPLVIENSDNALQLRVWADINSQDPTHVISLSGAKTSNRKEDEELDNLEQLTSTFILEIFDAPNNLTADQIELSHPEIKSWQFVGYREELDERYAAVEFDTKTPVTALSLGGDVVVSITDFEIQGANIYIANRK